MEKEGRRAFGWKPSGDAKTLCATLFSVLTSLVMVVLFLWPIWSESGVADMPGIKRESNNWAFCVGVLTIVLGFLFLAAGLPLLANLVMKLPEQLQKKQESSRKPQDQAGKLKTICIVSRIVVSIIAMIMLAWAINTGFRLATEPRREGKHYPLASPVGVVTIMFGFTYSIIGLCIIADLAVELTKQFQTTEKNENVNQQGISYKDGKVFGIRCSMIMPYHLFPYQFMNHPAIYNWYSENLEGLPPCLARVKMIWG